MLRMGRVVPSCMMEIIAKGKLLFITEAAACRLCLQPGAQKFPVETLNAIREGRPLTPARVLGRQQG